MPGIYIMAGLTIAITAVLSGVTLNSLTHSDRRYAWLVLAGLPLSLIVNRGIKTPLITGVGALAGIPLKLGPQMPAWFMVMIWMAAPIFEEAIKVLPLVMPGCRAFLRSGSQALWAGLALGLGFGMGEAAFLAYGLAQSPAYNTFAWYLFTGFAFERLIVTFGHGLMTSLTVLGFYYGGRKAVLGYLAAVGLHALVNLGPILSALKLLPASAASLGTYVTLLAAFVIFQKNLGAARKAGDNRHEPGEIIYFEQGG
jgi:uncharacterized membrane protein YhfC